MTGGERKIGRRRLRNLATSLSSTSTSAREGDVQRMLAMVSALQSEMASLKHENDRRLDPSREDSKSTPPETEEGR